MGGGEVLVVTAVQCTVCIYFRTCLVETFFHFLLLSGSSLMGLGQCNFPCAMGDYLPSLQCLDYVFSRKLKLPVAESLASFFCSSDKYFYNWNNHDAL